MGTSEAGTDARTAALGRPAAVFAVVVWGLGPVLVRRVDLAGLSIALHRTLLGAAIGVAAMALRGERLDRRTVRVAAPGGVAFGLNIALFFAAVKATSVTNATLITALQPGLVLVVAGRRFGERVTTAAIAWTAVATAGVALVVAARPAGGDASVGGDVLAVGALVTWAWYFAASKRARGTLGALAYQTGLLVWSAAIVAPLVVVSGEALLPRDAGTWAGIGLIVLVPGSGHLIMNWAHAHVALTLTSLLTLLSPVITVAAAALVLDEPVVALQLAGMVVVLGALAMVVSNRRTDPLEAPPGEVAPPDPTGPGGSSPR